MTRAALAIAICVAALPALASAQAPTLGLGRRLGRPLPPAPAPPAPSAPRAPASQTERPWPGPQVQLFYEHFELSDGWGGGASHAGGLGVYLQWPISELRTGLFASLGARDYALGGEDLIARGSLEVGFQLTELIDPLVPHLAFVATFGGVVGERFETTVAHAFGGAGFDLGATLRVYRNLHVSASFGYLRLEMDGAAFDVFLLRVSLGI